MREHYASTQQRKYYYRDQYRKIMRWIQWSTLLSVVLVVFTAYFYLRWPPERYYASNASYAGFVVKLNSMSEPNRSSTALLKPDIPAEIKVKTLELPEQATTTQAGVTSLLSPYRRWQYSRG